MVFLKAPLLDLYFYYDTLMTFLMKLFVIIYAQGFPQWGSGGERGVSYDFLISRIKTDTPNRKSQKQSPT